MHVVNITTFSYQKTDATKEHIQHAVIQVSTKQWLLVQIVLTFTGVE